MKLGRLFLIPVVPALALAADPGLLSLMPPDVKAVAGIEVAQARSSAFGQFLLSRMAPTGFDPSQSVTEIVAASDGGPKTSASHWLIAGTGAFDVQKLTAAAQAGGGTVSSFNGLTIVTRPAQGKAQGPTSIAFLDASTGVMGDIASVQTAIQQWQSKAPANSALLDKVNQVSGNQDFWFVTLVSPSQFTAGLPAANGLAQGNGAALLAAINQLSGGVHFGDTVTLSAQAVARSDKDAQALADVVRFAASLTQLNRQNNPTAGQLATLLDGLDLKTAANVTTLSLAIPEQDLEQLLPAGLPRSRQNAHSRRRAN